MLEQIQIGKVLKATGAQGAVKVQLDPEWEGLGDQLSVILLDIEGDRVPYFIDASNYLDTWIWHFDDVLTPEDAKGLTAAAIYALKRDIPDADEREVITQDFTFLKGWTITTPKRNIIGRIEDIRAFPEQWMAILLIDGAEKMIPVVEEFIVGIDEERESIQMDLPEGLLDL